jgi:hypothetical protein
VIGRAIPGGQHQDRQVTVGRAPLRADPHAVQAGEQHVEDHRVVVELGGPVQPVHAVRGDLHRVPLRGQPPAQRTGQQLIILYHQDTHI